jgi:hypothetical protein
MSGGVLLSNRCRLASLEPCRQATGDHREGKVWARTANDASVQLRKKVIHTAPKMTTANPTLMISKSSMEGPGSACRASMGVSMIIPCFLIAIRKVSLSRVMTPGDSSLQSSFADSSLFGLDLSSQPPALSYLSFGNEAHRRDNAD